MVLASIVAAAAAANEPALGVVDWVEDGDSLSVRLAEGVVKVRLANIDAPEICHPKHDPQCRRAGQPFGEEAKKSLLALAPVGEHVELRCQGRPDKYGRAVCEVWLSGVSINREQVYRGLAWYSPSASKQFDLQTAEFAARLARRGLWSQQTPVKPADWRRYCWKDGKCATAQ